MELKEAYNKMLTYFSKPNAVLAKDYDGSCCYRTNTGKKCAVGCLIPDEYYQEWMEGQGFTDLIHVCYEMVDDNWFRKNDVDSANWILDELAPLEHFLNQAQENHDHNSHDAVDFVHKLRELKASL